MVRRRTIKKENWKCHENFNFDAPTAQNGICVIEAEIPGSTGPLGLQLKDREEPLMAVGIDKKIDRFSWKSFQYRITMLNAEIQPLGEYFFEIKMYRPKDIINVHFNQWCTKYLLNDKR